ncbi:nitronate monooxygenase [Marasmitruncus massiliensis]|uniref:nitronate monooxygenase n=1 Tax=Marasmitruncus massiliensis TaxID=1944642 RepID=UPI000C7AA78B|nr:nitronate monooxygenase [Marasmitruncus massiliensis]
MKTKLTELLGIEYPVIQGGMAWVADAKLAAAVSEAGGLGLIGAANAPGEVVENWIREAKSLTKKPFGVNIMLMSPYADDIARICVEQGVKVITTGAGNPGKYMDMWKAAGIKVIPVVPSAALAKRMERAGADAVIAEGTESGGHIGELTTMALIPQVADAVSIPVIAAGGIADARGVAAAIAPGIADARGVAAAIALGACGVQCGTIFVCADESPAHDNFKRMIVEAKDTDTVVTGRASGAPVRCLKNKLTRSLLKLEHEEELDREAYEARTVGSLRKAVVEGDEDNGTFMAGQIAGLVCQIAPAAVIIEKLMKDSEALLKNLLQERGVTIA